MSRSAVDCEHIQAVNNNYNGGAGQRIYKLSTTPAAPGRSTTATATTSTTGRRVRPRRSIDVDDRRCRSRPSRTRTTRPSTCRTVEGRRRTHRQRRHPLGRRRTFVTAIRRRAFKLKRQLGAARRLRVGCRAEQPQQAVRELGPLLRERPDGHQHPRVRRRSPVLLLQLQPRRRATSCRIRQRRARELCSAERRPVDPDLKGQYIDEWLTGFEYDLGRNLVVGTKFTHREARPRDRRLPDSEPVGEYFIANPGSGSAPRWASTTACTQHPHRRRSAPARRSS